MPKTLMFLVLFSVPVCVRAANPFEIGRVADAKGAWQDARTNPPGAVQAGTIVFSDSHLRRASARSSADLIKIRSFFPRAGEQLFDCSKPAVCNDRDDDDRYVEVLDRLVPSSSPFGNFLRRLKPVPAISQSFQDQAGQKMAYFSSRATTDAAEWSANDRVYRSGGIVNRAKGSAAGAPGRPAGTGDGSTSASRAPRILTGVIPVMNGRADLLDVIKDLPDGDYQAKVCPLNPQGQFACETGFRSLKHRGKEPVYSDGFNPGAYLIHVGKTEEEVLSARVYIVALATPAENRAKLSELYGEALTVVKEWSRDSSPFETAVLYLFSLSAPQ